MNSKMKLTLFLSICITMASCVSKKQMLKVQTDLELANTQLGKCGVDLSNLTRQLSACDQEKETLKSSIKTAQGNLQLREDCFEPF